MSATQSLRTLCALVLAAAPVRAEWAMHRGNPQLQGIAESAAPAKAELAWTFNGGKPVSKAMEDHVLGVAHQALALGVSNPKMFESYKTFMTTMTTTATTIVAGLSRAPTYASMAEPIAATPVDPGRRRQLLEPLRNCNRPHWNALRGRHQ